MVKRLKDKNAPKRPLTGFLLYGNDLRAQDENIKSLPVTQQAGAIANMWRDLDEDVKQQYNQRSEELKEKYKQEMEVYEKSDAYREFQQKKKDADEEEGTTKRKRRRGPVKMSGYRLFMQENKDNLDDGLEEEDAKKKYIAKCGLRWKMLSEEERKSYNERAAAMEPTRAGDESIGDDE